MIFHGRKNIIAVPYWYLFGSLPFLWRLFVYMRAKMDFGGASFLHSDSKLNYLFLLIIDWKEIKTKENQKLRPIGFRSELFLYVFDGQNEVSIHNLSSREYVKIILTNDNEWYVFYLWRQINAIHNGLILGTKRSYNYWL